MVEVYLKATVAIGDTFLHINRSVPQKEVIVTIYPFRLREEFGKKSFRCSHVRVHGRWDEGEDTYWLWKTLKGGYPKVECSGGLPKNVHRNALGISCRKYPHL